MNATTPTPADTAKTIKALRKRLERWELEHLRQLAASLADRLEAAEQRIEALEVEAARAWDTADAWREDAQRLVEELEAAGATVGLTQGGALVVCDDAQPAAPAAPTELVVSLDRFTAQPAAPTQATGDAWRYCSNLGSPEAARALVQATLTASGTIRFALTQTGDAASFATVPDWQAVQRELLHALHVAGHPAGRA